jgi:tetratricopeptide (TPR) repeat protein
MPRTGSDSPHLTLTDHRVLRRPHSSSGPTADRWPAPGELPLVHFHRHLLTGPDPQVERDLGIALMRLADTQPSLEVVRSLAEQALPLLDTATARDEDDLPAWEAKGNALWTLNRLPAASAAYERVLRSEPERETTLYLAARFNLRPGGFDKAKSFAEQAIKVNPWRWEFHKTLAKALIERREWREATSSCQEVLKLNAADFETRRWLILCHLRSGDRGKAQQEYETLMEMKPPQAEELRRWFAQEMQKTK